MQAGLGAQLWVSPPEGRMVSVYLPESVVREELITFRNHLFALLNRGWG